MVEKQFRITTAPELRHYWNTNKVLSSKYSHIEARKGGISLGSTLKPRNGVISLRSTLKN